MNKLILFLIAIFAYCNANAKSIGIGLKLEPLVDKVDNSIKPSVLQSIVFWHKSGAPRCSGIKILLAFEKRGLESPVTPCAVKKYTISDLLKILDVSICQALVEERKKLGMTNFNDYTHEDFQKLNTIKKSYLDALPTILQEGYGKAAEPYIAEINQARKIFESENNGQLLAEL